MLEDFKQFMVEDGKSQGTVKLYMSNVNEYLTWYKDTYGEECQKLFRQNVLEYRSYLINIRQLNAKTINSKLTAILKYNEFMQPDSIVITNKEYIKVQMSVANPSDLTKQEVEAFRQKILVEEGSRNYAIITILAYGGLRISEALNIKTTDINLITKEIIVRNGKGTKQRTIYINDKIVESVKAYLAERTEDGSNYLFLSQMGGRLDRSSINKVFNKYSDKITPHKLRHFFCSNAIESGGYSMHEVANQAGHSNINTTLLYTNPNIEKMKQKANLL